MKKDKLRSLYLLSLAMGAFGDFNHSSNKIMDNDIESPEDIENKKHIIESGINKHRGLKCFWYGDNHVWAINQRNADKKAKKLNYLNQS